jgi:diguanylate cyclase (GGDEF)-like protein
MAAFFAGAPIIAADGRRTGVLWISDRAPRQLSDDQHENLRLLAGQAGRLLQRRAMPVIDSAVARLAFPPTGHSTASRASRTPAGSTAPDRPAAGTPEGAAPPALMTDPVTRRGNRFWFAAELGTTLRWAAASGTPISLITVDLARFNVLNTSLGPSVGDRVLRRAATDIASVLRRSDVLGRLGCDEFGILLPGADQRTAVAAAERIRAALLATERPDLVNVPLHAYFGATTYSPRRPGASRPPSANDMIRNSGLALAAAKREGPGHIRSYHSAMRTVARRQLALMEELTHAIDRGELHVHYQPLVILGTGRLRGAEALLRWNSARFGAVSPAEFIPLAEDTGLIVPIGRWVLEQACRDATSWSPRDRALGVSVNLSGYQLDDTIVPYVDDALRRSGLAPNLLTVEVTESALAADGGAAEELLHSLHALGVRLAVDDFGTGYSNLTALGHLPIDVLKIDKSFLDGIETEGRASRLLATVIAMGQGLGCTTLAEGIETLDQHQRLIELGCEHGQGFLFGRAAPGSVIEERTRTEILAQVERPAG